MDRFGSSKHAEIAARVDQATRHAVCLQCIDRAIDCETLGYSAQVDLDVAIREANRRGGMNSIACAVAGLPEHDRS